MLKCAIHQPHYFPWLGYLNKMAKVDKFILLDEAQIEKGSNMYRNKLSTWDGVEKYITVAYKKKECLEKKFFEIEIDDMINWQERQRNFIFNNYKKSPYLDEVWEHIHQIFEKKYTTLNEVVLDTIFVEKELFNVKTEIVFQSDLGYNRRLRKNYLLIDLCKQIDADYYLSGNGAKKYMEIEPFTDEGIEMDFQKYIPIVYEQKHEFIPNLSALDLLLCCGVEQANRLFWENFNDSL